MSILSRHGDVIRLAADWSILDACPVDYRSVATSVWQRLRAVRAVTLWLQNRKRPEDTDAS